jgi:DNA-binding NarL/FixJ family response regulator
VPVSAVGSFRSEEVTATYPAFERRPSPTVAGNESQAQKADTVALSGQARARSLKQQGFSSTMIATKMGLNLKTVQKYLGSSEPTLTYPKSSRVTSADQFQRSEETATAKTFVEANKLYSEPKLTGAAEARTLKQQGFSLAMIAAQMGLSLDTVKSYLGIS